MQVRYFFFYAVFLPGLLTSAVADEIITQEELVRRTQELFDAVVPGNPAPWKKYYADDCLFFDEKGRSLDKAALVANITTKAEKSMCLSIAETTKM